jgi:hypothetical protein
MKKKISHPRNLKEKVATICQVDNCGKIAQEVAFHIIITILSLKTFHIALHVHSKKYFRG